MKRARMSEEDFSMDGNFVFEDTEYEGKDWELIGVAYVTCSVYDRHSDGEGEITTDDCGFTLDRIEIKSAAVSQNNEDYKAVKVEDVPSGLIKIIKDMIKNDYKENEVSRCVEWDFKRCLPYYVIPNIDVVFD